MNHHITAGKSRGMHARSKLSSLGLNPDPAINCHLGVSQAGWFINVCAVPWMDVKLGITSADISYWMLMIPHLFVCLFVSRISQKVVGGFHWKLVDRLVAYQTNLFDFDENPYLDLDTRILKVILHHWEIGTKRIYNMISEKVLGEFWQSSVNERVRWQEKADLILVQIRMQIQTIGRIQHINCSAWRRYVLSWTGRHCSYGWQCVPKTVVRGKAKSLLWSTRQVA